MDIAGPSNNLEVGGGLIPFVSFGVTSGPDESFKGVSVAGGPGAGLGWGAMNTTSNVLAFSTKDVKNIGNVMEKTSGDLKSKVYNSKFSDLSVSNRNVTKNGWTTVYKDVTGINKKTGKIETIKSYNTVTYKRENNLIYTNNVKQPQKN
jgi:hypothetical protein